MNYLKSYDESFSGWPTEHNDFMATACYPNINPSIKAEFVDIDRIYHYSVDENTIHCIHLMKDGTQQLHSPHKIGECPFCEYKK